MSYSVVLVQALSQASTRLEFAYLLARFAICSLLKRSYYYLYRNCGFDSRSLRDSIKVIRVMVEKRELISVFCRSFYRRNVKNPQPFDTKIKNTGKKKLGQNEEKFMRNSRLINI